MCIYVSLQVAVQDDDAIEPREIETLSRGYLGIGDHAKAMEYAYTLLNSNQSNTDYQVLYRECQTLVQKDGEGFHASESGIPCRAPGSQCWTGLS